jgi:hypothetical protein
MPFLGSVLQSAGCKIQPNSQGAIMKRLHSSVVLALAISLLPSAVRAVPGDEHWDAQFGAPGMTNNFIYAAAVNNGMLYAAGITASGSRTNSPLYVWDGKQWGVAAMFNGVGNVQVNDLAFMGNTLYAAGNFTNVNGVVAILECADLSALSKR